MKRQPFLSLILPIFNEESRLENGLEKILKYLSSKDLSYEIIIVNDGSGDQSTKIVRNFQKNNQGITLISYKKNKGKGFAVRRGVAKARGQWILFCDIDLSVDINHYDKFAQKFKSKPLVLIASRRVEGSKILNRQAKTREILGQMYTKIARLVLLSDCHDFTCGFKVFDRSSAKLIFKKQKINRWGFDSEIIFLASKYSIPIVEVSVSWKNAKHSKVRFPQDIMHSLFELIQVRINNHQGLYDR